MNLGGSVWIGFKLGFALGSGCMQNWMKNPRLSVLAIILQVKKALYDLLSIYRLLYHKYAVKLTYLPMAFSRSRNPAMESQQHQQRPGHHSYFWSAEQEQLHLLDARDLIIACAVQMSHTLEVCKTNETRLQSVPRSRVKAAGNWGFSPPPHKWADFTASLLMPESWDIMSKCSLSSR